MLARLKSIAHRAARRMAVGSLQLVREDIRAEVIEAVSDQMVTVVSAGGDAALRFYTPTPLLRQRASTLLTKEPDMIKWIDGFSTGATLWDIGANVGVFSLYAATKTRCHVLAFEPSAANFHVLARNVGLNGLADHVESYCVALSSVTKLGTLKLASRAMGAALSYFGDAAETSPAWTGSTVGVHGMIGFTVDQFTELFRSSLPTHMKIDVDGLELAILKGARGTLADPQLKSVMVELSLTSHCDREEAVALLEAAGLGLRSQGESQGMGSERVANHLFTRCE